MNFCVSDIAPFYATMLYKPFKLRAVAIPMSPNTTNPGRLVQILQHPLGNYDTNFLPWRSDLTWLSWPAALRTLDSAICFSTVFHVSRIKSLHDMLSTVTLLTFSVSYSCHQNSVPYIASRLIVHRRSGTNNTQHTAPHDTHKHSCVRHGLIIRWPPYESYLSRTPGRALLRKGEGKANVVKYTFALRFWLAVGCAVTRSGIRFENYCHLTWMSIWIELVYVKIVFSIRLFYNVVRSFAADFPCYVLCRW